MNTKKNLIIHIILTCILLNSSIIAYGQNIGWSRMYSYDIPNLNAEFDRLSVILKNISIQSSQKEQTPLNLRAYDISTLPRFNLQSYNVQDTLYALDYQKLHRRNSPVMYRTMEQNLILGGSYATGINLSIGKDESPSYPLQIDRLAPQIVIKNSTSQYPFSISVPETTNPKAFKIGSVGVQTELEINTVDNRTYLSRPVSFNKNTGTAKNRYIADDATNYEIDVSTSLNISGNLNVSGLTTITTFTASGYGLINGTLSVVNSAYFSTATASGKMVSPIGLFNNVIADTTTLRNDLTTETNNRITADNNIAISTTALRNDLTTETNRATTRENEIAISTGTNYADIQTRMKKIADSNLTMNNYKIIASTISAISIEWQDGTILGNGNVGIGTTNPGSILHVRGTSPVLTIDSSGATDDLWTYYAQNGTVRAAVGYSNSNAGLTFYESGSNRMVIKSGNVGIGTTSPVRKLDVQGEVGIGGTTIGNIYVYNGSGSMGAQIAGATGNTFFAINGGKVGISTTSPVEKLHIANGKLKIDGPVGALLLYKDGNNSDIDPCLYLTNAANNRAYNFQLNSDGSGLDLWTYVGSWSKKITFLGNGNVGIGTSDPTRKLFVNGDAGGTTGWYNDSDAELKTNIRPITGALEKVKLLNGKYYEWKPELNRSSGTKIGFIAQDVINVIPEVVSKSGEYYGIAYADLVPLLTEAIKEQQLIIDDLKRRIELLESK